MPVSTPIITPTFNEDTAYITTNAELLSGFFNPGNLPLTISSVAAANATVTALSDGSGYLITPNLNYYGTLTLSCVVSDGFNPPADWSQYYEVMRVNDAPTGAATASLVAGTEDTSYTVAKSALLQGFSDVDGDVLSVANLAASNGSVVDNGNGTYTITPAANFNGPMALTYTVLDGKGGSIVGHQSVNLAAVNDAPTGSATAMLAPGLVGQPYSVTAADLLAGFHDPDGDTLTLANLSVVGGTIQLNGDGISYTITPPPGATAIMLGYEVVDNHGGSVGVSTAITLLANDLRTGNDALLVTRGMASSLDASVLLANDTVNPVAALSVTAVSNAVGGSVTLVDGQLVINATAAVGSFDYTVTAATGATATGHVDFDSVVTTNRPNTVTAPANLTAADIQGQGGADLLTGSAGDDRLLGNGGNDRLVGLGGDDRLVGGSGSDVMIGGAGNDSYWVDRDADLVIEKAGEGIDTVYSSVTETLSGFVENLRLTGNFAIDGTGNGLDNGITGNGASNQISGGEGKDVLAGGGGCDRLNGGSGNDVLIGGAGDDVLVGGFGADVFRFESLNDFDPASRAQETIGDFRRAQGDLIDLSLIDANTALAGDQAFDFIGTAGFGHNAGELRYAVSKGGALVSGDVDGDGVADFSILVNNVSSLGSVDFAV